MGVDSPERKQIVEAGQLLGQLLLQDVERKEEGPTLKEGVSRDHIPSVHDPEMRHGRKSSSKRFDGHKAAMAVDTDSRLITAVDVLAENASDNVGALELVEQSEENTGRQVEETIGDAAYGDGATRQAFADACCPLPIGSPFVSGPSSPHPCRWAAHKKNPSSDKGVFNREPK